MKYLKLFLLSCVLAFTACASTGDPQQDYLKAATYAATLVDQVTLAADKAVLAGVLKGDDARTTLAAIKAARDGLKSSNALAAIDPKQALGALGIATATLTASQTYLNTIGAKK